VRERKRRRRRLQECVNQKEWKRGRERDNLHIGLRLWCMRKRERDREIERGTEAERRRQRNTERWDVREKSGSNRDIEVERERGGMKEKIEG
jgi:hypothetical protein